MYNLCRIAPDHIALNLSFFYAVWMWVQYDDDGFDHYSYIFISWVELNTNFSLATHSFLNFSWEFVRILYCNILEENAQHKHKCLFALA